MLTKEKDSVVLGIENAAMKNPKWADYAAYCFDREKGLRKSAFKRLDKFLESTEDWSLDDRIEFVKFLFSSSENAHDAMRSFVPYQLNEKLVKPTLLAWCNIEQTDSSPFRWRGQLGGCYGYEGEFSHDETYLFKALDLNPADDLARITMIDSWLRALDFHVHELPWGYLGIPSDDMKLCEKINEHIQQLTKPELRESRMKNLEHSLELVRNYIEWKTSQHPDFEKWGEENNKRTSVYGMRRYTYTA
ncbi:MAG: hypothetical protein LBQ75_09815 [Zoogloeaceae bacterium]|nr:hypothetical protein [Zoogloeaceae bacterium]